MNQTKRIARQRRAKHHNNDIKQGIEVDPEHLTCAAGAGAIIDLLFHCLASPGDAVLIPAPYYPAFDNDLGVRNGAAAVPVYLSPESLGGNGSGGAESLAAQLDAAAAAAASGGRAVRALLVSNPSNPLGTVVAEADVRAMMAWCLANGVHFVRWVSESVSEGEGASFLFNGAHLGPALSAARLIIAPFLVLSLAKPRPFLSCSHSFSSSSIHHQHQQRRDLRAQRVWRGRRRRRTVCQRRGARGARRRAAAARG